MARQSSSRPDADEPELDETTTAVDSDRSDADAGTPDRSLWSETGIDPVEIALPSGTGYTLRAYRSSGEVTMTDVGDRDQDDPFLARGREVVDEDDETVVILDEELAAEFAESDEDVKTTGRARGRAARSDEDEETGAESEETAEAEEKAEAEEEETSEESNEEVPVFLSHQGRLLLFRSAESLVSFVRSGAPNDLAQVDGWDTLVEKLQPADVAPLDEDTYELDLVVENLRGGHDVWDPNLLIEAGEVARDLSYALRLPSVLEMLSAGSSLDDLDEALRASVNGGIGGFFGRRRLKKIGAQTASLGWRTIVGKISAVVDWRD